MVVTGPCDITGLTEFDLHRTFRIDDFCKFIQDPQQRKSRLARGYESNSTPFTAPNSSWRVLLSRFFGASSEYFKPLTMRYGDYRVISDQTYEHPKKLYAEYDVEEVSISQGFGLLRMWDFSLAEPLYAAVEGRTEIAGREQNVITFLVDRQPDLENILLHPKVADPDKGIHYWEIFERRRQLKRIQEFLVSHSDELTTGTRLDLIRTLLAHVASMHRLGAAHLDLGDHSVWLELPSSVRISHLVAASYQELTSLGDRRYEFLANNTVLPEFIVDQGVNHLRRDVFLLGVVTHTILFGKRPCTDGELNPPSWDSSVDTDGSLDYLHDWFRKSLDEASLDRFASAQEMLDAFNKAIASSAKRPNGLERLQKHRVWKSLFALMMDYPSKKLLKENDRILSWLSEKDETPVLVKAWRRACWGDEVLESPRLAKFCEDAEDLILCQPVGINRLMEVGYLGDHLALVQEYVDAQNLSEHVSQNGSYWSNSIDAASFLRKLTLIVMELHDGGRSHGDLTPGNILVVPSTTGPNPLLIDMLDFGPAHEGSIRTGAYSPDNDLGTRERDRFAVLKISEELLIGAQLTESSLGSFMDALNTCRQTTPILSTLSPLLEALDRLLSPSPSAETAVPLSVVYPGLAGGILAPDDGGYFVQRRNKLIVVTGETEELLIYFDPTRANRITRILRVHVKQSQVAAAEKRATERLAVILETMPGIADTTALEQHLRIGEENRPQADSPTVEAEGFTEPQRTRQVDDELDEDVSIDSDDSEESGTSAEVAKLWEMLLKVEEEQTTKGVAEADSFYNRGKRRHFISFQVTTGSLDFARDEEVRVEIESRAKTWMPIGLLDLDLSRPDEIAVDASHFWGRDGAKLCSVGSELRFKSTSDSDNRSRRTIATHRILKRTSVLPDLIDYFSGENLDPLRQVPVSVTAEFLIQRYQLNSSQADAFLKVIATRSLGLLQGPPGTGKTKFIAALIHYLLSNNIIKNVLLASQSNEAVNTATEGVLRLFRVGDTEPSLVRVGREALVSPSLQSYHSAKVEEHYRERFRAGLKERFQSAAKHIGLTDVFSNDLFIMESTVVACASAIARNPRC